MNQKSRVGVKRSVKKAEQRPRRKETRKEVLGNSKMKVANPEVGQSAETLSIEQKDYYQVCSPFQDIFSQHGDPKIPLQFRLSFIESKRQDPYNIGTKKVQESKKPS